MVCLRNVSVDTLHKGDTDDNDDDDDYNNNYISSTTATAARAAAQFVLYKLLS